jgi:hypothetical protein
MRKWKGHHQVKIIRIMSGLLLSVPEMRQRRRRLIPDFHEKEDEASKVIERGSR